METRIREAELTPEVLAALIALSADWEAEQSCHGYRRNTAADIRGTGSFFWREREGSWAISSAMWSRRKRTAPL